MSKAPQVHFEIGQIDEKKIARQLGGLQDKVPVVIRRAVNRTATHLQKPIKNETLKNYAVTNIRKKDIQKTLTVYKARKGEEISAGVMSIADRGIPLYRFETSRRQPVRENPPKFIYARVLLSSEMKKLKGSPNHSKGFIMRTASGHVGVFERRLGVLREKQRPRRTTDEKVEEVLGPSIPSMIRNKKSSDAIVKDGTKFLQRQIDHEIEFQLRKLK